MPLNVRLVPWVLALVGFAVPIVAMPIMVSGFVAWPVVALWLVLLATAWAVGRRYPRTHGPPVSVLRSPEFDLRSLLDAASELDGGAVLALGAEPSLAQAAERERARKAAGAAIARQGLSRQLERVGAEILRWSTADGARSGAYSYASPPTDLWLSDLRHAAVPALMDAAMALLLADALDPASRAVLLARWTEVTGGVV